MLARIANSLYWTGRYIERSEHLSRYLRVQYFSILDTPMSQNKDFVLKSIMNMYGVEFDAEKTVSEPEVLAEVGFNKESPASLISTIFSARENARSVRHSLSTELWEVINQYYLFLKEYDIEFYQSRGLYDFTINVAKHCAIIRSYLDHTLLHDEAWLFITLGIYLERAAQIARILSSKLEDVEILSEYGTNIPLRQYQWTISLKVLEAFDMHRRLYRKPPTQHTLFEFLTSNEQFPRSIAYNLKRVHELVKELSQMTKSGENLVFKAGKLSSHFQYLEYKEIQEDLPQFISQSLAKIYELHMLIEQEYFQTNP